MDGMETRHRRHKRGAKKCRSTKKGQCPEGIRLRAVFDKIWAKSGADGDGRRNWSEFGRREGRGGGRGRNGTGTERRQEDEMPPLTPFGSTSSPFVCCCSVCLHSSPLLSRSLFLPSANTTLLDKTAPSASMPRHRSRIAKGDIFEHKLGRIGSDLRLNLTKGMDKIRYRMALLNTTRHCPSAHFCAFGKRLFPQQANNVKNLATKMKAANSSRTTAPIGANKSTFYVTTEEGEEGDEAGAGEDDEFADDWSTTSSGSSQDKRQDEADGRCWKDAEDAERSERAFNAPSTTTQCPQQQPPSLWEEIESEYQQLVVERRRRRQGQAENCPHQSMDTFCAVDIDTLCPPSRPSTAATATVFANLEHFPQQNPTAVPETCDDSAETGPTQPMKSSCPSSSSSSSSYCCSSPADSVAYTSRLPIQQPLYQIYMLQEEHPLADVSASASTAAVASDPCSFVVSAIDDIPSVAPLRLETIAEVAGGDSQPKSVAAGVAEQRGLGVRGTRNELEKVEETDSACNDPTENGSVGSSCAVNVHRHSSTASSSADSGRADSLSRLSSHPNTPNVSQPPVRRERLLGGSKFGSQRSLWCELPEVKEAGFLDKMDSGEKKLQEAYFEVITSEASYLRSLSFLISHFMCTPEMFGPKSKRSVISSSERKQLFSNIVAIRDCSERLLCELETRLKESLVLSELCDILCEHFERHFSPYVNYCSNQVYQDRTLKALKLRLEADRQCQGLDMRSFLLLPMQRITRYPLLIYAILDRLHPAKLQHSVATRALTLAIQVVRNCNEGARKMERTEQLLEIDSKIVYRGSELRRVPLVSSGRYVVKSGRLLQFVERRSASTLKMRHLMLFLFSDLLLISKGRPNGTFTCKDYALRRFVVAEPLEANDARVPPRAAGSGCSLHLILCKLVQNAWGNQVELLLNADSESDRERWLAAMRPPSCTNPDEKIYAEWDCPQAVAVHNYAIQQEDELDLTKGDLVNILRKMPDGWFYGERTRDGKSGWFPSSYVQQVMNDHIRANNYRQRLGVLQQRSGDGVFRRGSSLQAMPNGSDSSLSHTQQHEYALLNRLRRLSSPFGVAPLAINDDFYDESQDHLYLINEDENASNEVLTFEDSESENTENVSNGVCTASSLNPTPSLSALLSPEGHSSAAFPIERSLEFLKKYFGYSRFRPLQCEVIDAALRNRDQLVVLSTGYGKSVCYQLPSLIRNNLTLVVSPLISLMEDQVNALEQAGVDAAYFGGNQTKESIFDSIKRGRLRILYITPEAYQSTPDFIRKIHEYVGLLAVDEAHCISQWGHEFRPGYRQIAGIRNVLVGVPVMALTATATAPVRNDIIQNLRLNNPKVTMSGFDRKNLFIEVQKRTQALSFEKCVQNDLERLLEDDPKLGPNFGGPTIIYCQSRESVNKLTQQLRSIGVRAVGYHAGMTTPQRHKAHKDFATDRATTCVATIAFGMGIDKKDVRRHRETSRVITRKLDGLAAMAFPVDAIFFTPAVI
uniref:DNA helicase n=1 Tax=Globodera pallida TaxID=36090 RepID=A0A183CD64_GLOPA